MNTPLKLEAEKDNELIEIPIDFSKGTAFWTAENDNIICYFISENVSAGPGMKVDVIKPRTTYLYSIDAEANQLTSGTYDNGIRTIKSGPDNNGQLALFDVDHESPKVTYWASNRKFLIYSFYFITYISFVSKAKYGETFFVDTNISTHAANIVDRFVDLNIYRFQDIKNINNMSRKDFLDYTISSPIQMIKENLRITQISKTDIDFAFLLGKDILKKYWKEKYKILENFIGKQYNHHDVRILMCSDKTNVKVSLRFLRNLGNYETIAVELGVEDWVRDGETATTAMDRVYDFVESQLIEKVQDIEADINGSKQKR